MDTSNSHANSHQCGQNLFVCLWHKRRFFMFVNIKKYVLYLQTCKHLHFVCVLQMFMNKLSFDHVGLTVWKLITIDRRLLITVGCYSAISPQHVSLLPHIPGRDSSQSQKKFFLWREFWPALGKSPEVPEHTHTHTQVHSLKCSSCAFCAQRHTHTIHTHTHTHSHSDTHGRPHTLSLTHILSPPSLSLSLSLSLWCRM